MVHPTWTKTDLGLSKPPAQPLAIHAPPPHSRPRRNPTVETVVETGAGSFTGNATVTVNVSIPNVAPSVSPSVPSVPSASTDPMPLAPEMMRAHLPSALPNTQEKSASRSMAMVTPSTAVMDADMDVNNSPPFTHSAAVEKPDFDKISMDPDAEDDDDE
ncbi:hypothetical protein B0H14DRAFT_3518742 [Mycena olivaceomarginata]|nr:hypothetical protein B0H14DRAFT_3518742 [Mycena olivaceomarginata]